ncbi:protein shuttle craft [Toxorhynchites rutilus septentrionalis]|uniref:protein shuttle craft n=1 Tax=Toxorhynchites rutilus septentrionalis TaxID=329112 RepID=UPI0024787A1D|nr:protein shuttle craft [Toxorhynchites rutilus septentrionalis]
MADGGEGSSSASSARHQSFEQFVSQFAARASVHDFSSQNGAGESGAPMAAPESSNLKPTATEFFPRFPKHNLRDQDQSNGHSDARSEERAKGAVRRQYDGSKWNNGRRNNRNGVRNGFGRNRESNLNTFRDRREGDDEGRFYEGSNYSDRRDLGNGFRPHQQNRPFQQNGRWKPHSGNRYGGGRNGRDQRQEQDNYNGQFNTNREVHKEIEMKERRPNVYQRNRARLDKLEARILSKCSQREKLTRELESSKLECLVCCELVRPAQPIWSCPNCYHVLHLNCTTKWASSSKSDEGWRCPACQNITQKIPREYYCFCGKQKNPQYNRTDVAHSCGELCAREELCEHPCTLLCHPGPCPPCQAMVQRSCGCGRSVKPMQCSQKEEIMCESICEKPLNCGIHSCQQKCHSGECNECVETLEHECHCGKEKKNVSCNVINLDNTRFSCGKVCQAELDCKNHECMAICHKGPCGKCALSPEMVTSCPCGKQAVASDERLTCLDPIPLCKGVCGKQLICGNPGSRHLCTARCHLGQCSACNKSTVVKCRCGHMDQQIKCKELESRGVGIKCKKRCTKMRSCGKHKCNQECCIDIDHICHKTCSQMLSCGRHRCDKPCHKGSCSACHRTSFDELTCECGASVIFPPVPCGTKKPLCDKPCTRPHRCTHPVLHNCHSDPDCPPCVVLTSQFCYGKHEQRKTIPCYQDSFSCGLPCSKPLPCGRHKCIKPCHENECFTEGAICKQSCTTTRTGCPHQCKAPCHDGECPTDLPCKEMVEVQCECGNRKQMRTCYDFSKEYRRITSAQLASSMLEMQRGGSVELSDIIGPVKPKNNKTLECSEECRQLERNRRLAIGLQIRNPDISAKLQPNYSEFLKTFARKDPALIKMIHEKLSELVKLAKESKQKSRSYSFPVMNREKRHVVHEMCAMFGIESVAYDAEPNRNVVATADRFKSWLPSMSLLEVLQRENGQRRVIVPNLNAWGRTANSTK